MTGQGHLRLWLPGDHCQRQHGTWRSHLSDPVWAIWMAPNSPPSQLEKYCTTCIPLCEAICIHTGPPQTWWRWPLGLPLGADSVWPALCRSYLCLTHSGLLSRLLFESCCGPMTCFMNPFAIMLCLDSWKWIYIPELKSTMGRNGAPAHAGWSEGPRMWLQTLSEDNHVSEDNPHVYILEVSMLPNIC